MIRLSVNVNKVATLRNSRGGAEPSVLDAVRVIVAQGAPGVTVHPRADERHITGRDVRDIAALLAPLRDQVEYNIEGDPRPELLAMVHEVRPHQCTLVPVKPGEITSEAGWPPDMPRDAMTRTVRELREAGIRVSLFVDPTPAAIALAADLGATAWSSTPSRSPAPSNAGPKPRPPVSRTTPARPRRPMPAASA